jgi:hypothetical protein
METLAAEDALPAAPLASDAEEPHVAVPPAARATFQRVKSRFMTSAAALATARASGQWL